MKRLSLIIACILLVWLTYNYYHKPKSVPVKQPVAAHVRPQVLGTQEVCSFNAPPCIKLVTPDMSYGLNDFRLYNRNCIAFVSLPDHVQRTYCGRFDLRWEGPENT